MKALKSYVVIYYGLGNCQRRAIKLLHSFLNTFYAMVIIVFIDATGNVISKPSFCGYIPNIRTVLKKCSFIFENYFLFNKVDDRVSFPVNILFKVSDGNTRTMSEIC